MIFLNFEIHETFAKQNLYSDILCLEGNYFIWQAFWHETTDETPFTSFYLKIEQI